MTSLPPTLIPPPPVPRPPLPLPSSALSQSWSLHRSLILIVLQFNGRKERSSSELDNTAELKINISSLRCFAA